MAAGGLWPEERRWQSGMAKSPLCTACGLERGTHWHRIHDCAACDAEKSLRTAACEYRRLPSAALEGGLAPLAFMGLPPLPLGWQPEEIEVAEGGLPIYTDGPIYGDGSGFHQSSMLCRSSCWSLIRMHSAFGYGDQLEGSMAGSVGGWEPNVPRAELKALIAFLRQSSAGAYYVGDCRYVLEGAERGVPAELMSSAAADPDLWRVVNALIKDHGVPPKMVKVKAHRSAAVAAAENADSLLHWHGNAWADRVAKSLCRRRLVDDCRPQVLAESEELSVDAILCVARGAGMAVSMWPGLLPEAETRCKPGRGALATAGDEDIEEDHIVRRTDAGHFQCTMCKNWHTPRQARAGCKCLHVAGPSAVRSTKHTAYAHHKDWFGVNFVVLLHRGGPASSCWPARGALGPLPSVTFYGD